jgi:hypothetical protein
MDKYDMITSEGDSIKLLKSIKALLYNFQSTKYRPLAIHDGTHGFYQLYQDKHTTCQDYLDKFQNSVDVLAHWGGSIGQVPGIMKLVLKESAVDPLTVTIAQLNKARRGTQEQYLAIAFLM